MALKIGTAGWTIAKQVADQFPTEGSALERYAQRFEVAEINSSFHRPHRQSTWERWRDSVPSHFRFSVKLPKVITHQRKLLDCAEPLTEFLQQVSALRDNLAVLLVQLPPKLEFYAATAESFFADLRRRTGAAIACEPRHPSWFMSEANAHLIALGVSRVAADPAICDEAAKPGGSRALSYWRLHGSPVMYRSSYADRTQLYAAQLLAESSSGRETWCVFDNTASSAATGDALALLRASGAATEAR